MEGFYAEHSPERNFHSKVFVPESALPSLTGFRSITQYERAHAKEAEKERNLRVLRQYPHLIDTLYIDFDSCVDKARDFRNWLVEKDYTYSAWNSGGRSIHFHVKMDPIFGRDAAWSVKQFMTALDSGADLSFLHYIGLYRLPGTRHIKTGLPKRLLEESDGVPLIIPLLVRPPSKFDDVGLDADLMEGAMLRYTSLLNRSPGDGNRFTTQWSLGKNFCDSGISYDTALELILTLNGSWGGAAKDEEEVERAVKGAFE